MHCLLLHYSDYITIPPVWVEPTPIYRGLNVSTDFKISITVEILRFTVNSLTRWRMLWLLLVSLLSLQSASPSLHSGGLWLRGGDKRDKNDDLSLNAYTSNGDIAQYSYAAKAIERSSPLIGFVVNNTAVIVSFSVPVSPLSMKPRFNIDTYDDYLATAVTGITADCDYLRSHTNRLTQSYKLTYGEGALTCDGLSSKISTYVTRGMYPQDADDDDKISRPLATSMILSSYSNKSKQAKLLLVANNGIISDSPFAALGVSPPRRDELLQLVQSTTTGSIKQMIEKAVRIILSDEKHANYEFEFCIISENGVIHSGRMGSTADIV